MTLYKNKYRVESARLKGWDYSSPGHYFITICTKNRECFFGNVLRGEIVLSEIGKIVDSEWLKSFEIRSELWCDEYCIMPNHIHGIVIINGNDGNGTAVEAHGRAPLRPNNTPFNIKRSPRSISSFVAGFKSSATKIINELRNTPGIPVWQPRFHDHIIRDENELRRIRQYIIDNPVNWQKDDNYIT